MHCNTEFTFHLAHHGILGHWQILAQLQQRRAHETTQKLDHLIFFPVTLRCPYGMRMSSIA
uniref:Uncharacterized protein n=1 Tax=Ascaris lumbricoides TaxID=6252 RepID=A0A0M3HTZ9_ASCLU